MEQEGFVASENCRGFDVRPIDIEETWEAFGLREALEVYAVEHAIKSGDKKDIQILEEKMFAHAQYTPAYYTQEKFLMDQKFHAQIASMANNKILKFQLKRSFEHIYLRSRLNDYDIERMEISANDHSRLVDRIRKKDILGSVNIIRSHIQSARDLVIRCLSKGLE